jgi:hypothetical protein
MSDYRVVWEIELEAESAREAAEMALNIQRDPESIATVYAVFDEEGGRTAIDLLDEDSVMPGDGVIAEAGIGRLGVGAAT